MLTKPFEIVCLLTALIATPGALADFDVGAGASPSEKFQRTSSVLNHFGTPTEGDSQPLVDFWREQQTIDGFKALLPIFDPKKTFGRFSSLEQDPDGGWTLNVFQDKDSKTVLDFSIPLAKEALGPAEAFHTHLQMASQNPSALLLSGLRIAIDPGHMGGEEWDLKTGKFVSDGHGHKISEGLMNLQVSMLLQKEFETLGAEVLLSHTSLAPATALRYENLDVSLFGAQRLGESTMSDWFQKLISGALSGSALFAAFEKSSDLRGLFSESMRGFYFIRMADLDARSETMMRFSPDISLIIHFDSLDSPGGYDGVKTFIDGGALADEFGTRDERVHFAQNILDARAWSASRTLSSAIANALKTELKIPFDASTGGGLSVPVEPGVFARNLRISRKLHKTAMSSVECLYYDAPKEFNALLEKKYSLEIDGVDYSYSERLAQVVKGIKAGVTGFVLNY
ncbi:hypothetical protein WDW86_18565 [Bdellovibrionota bacterium FG-2]